MDVVSGGDGAALRIGSLAAAAGVGIETVRYYQRRGLLAQPQRPYGGQRAYRRSDVDRLRFIKRAQALGFTLDEIGELLKLDAGTGHARAHALGTRRLAEIEGKLADLTAIRDALRSLLRRCEHSRGRVACPIIDALAPAAVKDESPAAEAGGAAGGRRGRPRVPPRPAA